MPAMSHWIELSIGMKEGQNRLRKRAGKPRTDHPPANAGGSDLTPLRAKPFPHFAIDTTARVYLTCPAVFGEPGGLIR